LCTAGAEAERPVRWEFYLGGTVGVLLAFVLRAGGLPADEILGEAVAAVVRAVAWFAAFALFERLAWPERGRVLALTAGVASLLLYLSVAGGISWPAVAGPLWVAVGLALAHLGRPALPWLSRQRAARLLPLPVLLATALGYFAFLFYPVADAAALTQRALRSAGYFAEHYKKPEKEWPKRWRPDDHLKRAVLGPLRQAESEDPGNARLDVYLAEWHGQLWGVLAAGDPQADPELSRAALRWASRAQRLNPQGLEGYLAEYQARRRFAETDEGWSEALAKQAREGKVTEKPPAPDDKGAAKAKEKTLTAAQREHAWRLASQKAREAAAERALGARALEQGARRDPTSPRLRYRLAETRLAEAKARLRSAEVNEGWSKELEKQASAGRVDGKPLEQKEREQRQRLAALKAVEARLERPQAARAEEEGKEDARKALDLHERAGPDGRRLSPQEQVKAREWAGVKLPELPG
jgi:hypothetical protein